MAADKTGKSPMTDAHKAALAVGRDEARQVKAYLEAIEDVAPKRRGRRRTKDSIGRRLEAIDAALPAASALVRLQLLQERSDLEAELAAMQVEPADLTALRERFVKVARAYGERKGISYATWRTVGVDADTLAAAGIRRGVVTADDLLLAIAGFAAGMVNGVAGGGSLISFPALLAVGHSAVVANVTSTVGIWAGYLGGVAGFRRELTAQADRVRALLPVGLAGGLMGVVLLLITPSDVFEGLAPVLVLLACGLFAVQPRLAHRLQERSGARRGTGAVPALALGGTFLGAIYGGYFGAGLGVVLLAVLGLALDDELVRVNGLRGVLSLIVNSIAVVVFAVAADVAWHDAGVLTVTSLVGGYAGARLSRRLPVPVFRAVVIGLGLVAAARMLLG